MQALRHGRYQPEVLYFECLLDVTNAMKDDDGEEPVHNTVNALEEGLYDYNTEGHRPSFDKVEYGNITFFGHLKTLETEYTLFKSKRVAVACRTKSDTDRLLQPEGGEEALLQTLAGRVAAGYTKRGTDACCPL